MTNYQISNLGKKSLGLAVGGLFLFTLFFNLTPSYALPTSCPQDLKTGDELKVPGKPAIYVLDKDLKPLYFPSGYVYKTYKTTYSGYKSITQECLVNLPQPPKAPYGVGYRPGSYVVKKSGETQLYAVLPGNALAKISDSVARVLHGTNYPVRTLEYSEGNNYVCKKADITTAKVYPGMAVRLSSDTSKVWYLDTQNRLREISPNVLAQNYLISEFIYTVPDSAVQGYAKGDMVTTGLGELMDRTQTTIDCNGNGGNNNPPQPPQPPQPGDKIAPTVSLTSPAVNFLTVDGVIRPSADASDNVGVTKVEFLFNNSVVGIDMSAPFTIDWDTKNTANGTGSLQAKAYDAAGNSAMSSPLTLTVKNLAAIPQETGILKVEMVQGGGATPNSEQTALINSVVNTPPTVFALKLTAEKEPIELRSLKVNVNGLLFTPNDIVAVQLYDGVPPQQGIADNLLDSMGSFACSDVGAQKLCSKTLSKTSNILSQAIQPGNSVTLYMRAFLNIPGKARVGDTFFVSVPVADVVGYGVNSKKDIKAVEFSGNGTVELKNSIVTRIAPWNVTLSAPFPAEGAESIQAPIKGSLLGSVYITNGSGSIEIASVNYSDSGTHQGGDTTYDLVFINEAKSTVETVVTNNPTLNFRIPNLYKLDPGNKINMMVWMNKPGSSKSGDTWMLSLKSSGVGYYVNENQGSLGYDNNGDGDAVDYVWSPLFAEGVARAGVVRMQ
jgi:hypothetical protein